MFFKPTEYARRKFSKIVNINITKCKKQFINNILKLKIQFLLATEIITLRYLLYTGKICTRNKAKERESERGGGVSKIKINLY